jgi:hypothetical protein
MGRLSEALTILLTLPDPPPDRDASLVDAISVVVLQALLGAAGTQAAAGAELQQQTAAGDALTRLIDGLSSRQLITEAQAASVRARVADKLGAPHELRTVGSSGGSLAASATFGASNGSYTVNYSAQGDAQTMTKVTFTEGGSENGAANEVDVGGGGVEGSGAGSADGEGVAGDVIETIVDGDSTSYFSSVGDADGNQSISDLTIFSGTGDWTLSIITVDATGDGTNTTITGDAEGNVTSVTETDTSTDDGGSADSSGDDNVDDSGLGEDDLDDSGLGDGELDGGEDE